MSASFQPDNDNDNDGRYRNQSVNSANKQLTSIPDEKGEVFGICLFLADKSILSWKSLHWT